MAEVIIDGRFCGPRGSANGGYACGMVAQFIDGPAEVTLRAPPPLDRPLSVIAGDNGEVSLSDGELLIAAGRPTRVEVDVPAPVDVDQAHRAAARYEWRDEHPYPTCFVCGPQRVEGDGLRIFPGPVEGRDLYAAPWTPDESLWDESGLVRDEFVWAALDCPSGLVTNTFGELGPILLGRLAADLREPVPGAAGYVLISWPVGREGRKLHTSSALLSDSGTIHAVARALWIEVTLEQAAEANRTSN